MFHPGAAGSRRQGFPPLWSAASPDRQGVGGIMGLDMGGAEGGYSSPLAPLGSGTPQPVSMECVVALTPT